MKKNRLAIVLISLSSIFFLTGCFGVNGEFKGIRNSVIGSLNGNFHKDIEFSVGSAGLSLAGLFVSFGDTDEPVEEMLDKVKKVQIGIYKYHCDNFETNSFTDLKQLNDDLKDDDWECIVRNRDYNELSSVYVQTDDDSINRLLVISLSNDELVIAEIRGRLEQLVEIAIREHGFEINH